MACAKDLEGGPRAHYCFECHRFDGVKRPCLVFTGISGFQSVTLERGVEFLKPSEVCTCSYCHHSVTDQCYSVYYLSSEDGGKILLGFICAGHTKEPQLQQILFENFSEKMRQLAETKLAFVDVNNEPIE